MYHIYLSVFFFFFFSIMNNVAGLCHITNSVQLLQHQLSGHRLGLLWCWMVCLENKPRPFCCFCDCTNVLYLGWLTSRNQDCWENYQQPHICRWNYSTGRKWRGTKESLDDVEREWKSWLETQRSNNQNYGIWFHHFMTNRRGRSRSSDILYFLGLQNHCRH